MWFRLIVRDHATLLNTPLYSECPTLLYQAMTDEPYVQFLTFGHGITQKAPQPEGR